MSATSPLSDAKRKKRRQREITAVDPYWTPAVLMPLTSRMLVQLVRSPCRAGGWTNEAARLHHPYWLGGHVATCRSCTAASCAGHRLSLRRVTSEPAAPCCISERPERERLF